MGSRHSISGDDQDMSERDRVVAGRVRRGRAKAWRWRAGLLLSLTGAVLVAHSAYGLWGTGIGTARAQQAFRDQLRRNGFPERPVPGGAIGFIRIPRLEVDMAFVQGVTVAALSKGPGHYPGTPLPGQGGNVAIAGHRTTHLAPFWSLDRLQAGDDIFVRTSLGRFVYRVQWSVVVDRSNWSVTASTDLPALTLTTCFPRFSGRQRLVVRAVQVYGTAPGGFINHLAHAEDGLLWRGSRGVH